MKEINFREIAEKQNYYMNIVHDYVAYIFGLTILKYHLYFEAAIEPFTWCLTVNFERISHLVLVLQLVTLNM